MSNDRRSDVLLYEWENDHHAWIGGTHVSHKCTNREYQPMGLGLIAALVKAATVVMSSVTTGGQEGDTATPVTTRVSAATNEMRVK